MLLVVLVAGSAIAPDAFASGDARTASCHASAHHSSSLRSVDFSCCQGGHNLAWLQAGVEAVVFLPFRESIPAARPPAAAGKYVAGTIHLPGSPPVSPPLII